jgi:hypothetical protein
MAPWRVGECPIHGQSHLQPAKHGMLLLTGTKLRDLFHSLVLSLIRYEAYSTLKDGTDLIR